MKLKAVISILILTITCCLKAHPAQKPVAGNPNGVYAFSGKLNDKIPVLIWFALKDNVLKGQVTYLKSAKRVPITIIGTIDSAQSLSITEFSKTGNISGFYMGQINGQSFSGTWHAPGSEKQLKFSLIKKDTVINAANTDLKSANVTGSYGYSVEKFGAGGGIDIQQTKPGFYTFRINCVTPSPINDVADAQAVNVKMVNNIITYKMPDADCIFTIKAYNGFIVIDYVGQHRDCQFGAGADIAGIFLKTSDKADVQLL